MLESGAPDDPTMKVVNSGPTMYRSTNARVVEYQKKIETGENIIVGVNKFQNEETGNISLLKIDDSIRQMQSERLQKLRTNRLQQKAKECLSKIEATAKDGSNLMPHVIEAVENYCTLGEIADCLRKVFGEYK